jgi:hypothetical protein
MFVRALVGAASVASVLLLTTGSFASSFDAGPSCPGLIHEAQVNLATISSHAPPSTQVDIENAKIILYEAQLTCEVIPRGMYCREKDWSLATLERIAERAVEQGTGDQATLTAARTRLAAHRSDCGLN